MGILDSIKPDAPYDRTEAALLQLDPQDRKQILEALTSGQYKNVTIARILTENTTETVDPNSIGGFKAKYRAGKVTL